MDEPRPIVVRPDEGARPPGPPPPGMDRSELIDDRERWVGWVQTDAGVAGGWHHHGARDSYIYVLRGTVRIEYGPAGREHLTARAGDFIFNPAGMVHREITGPDEPAEFFVVRIGPGPQNVNVDRADDEADER